MKESENFSVKQIIDQTIELFKLDLSGLTVLTEAANGNYYVTPLIAASAGANVYAFAKDSSYGQKEHVVNYVATKIAVFSNDYSIQYITDLSDQIIQECQIITNLGMLRPLDKDLIRRLIDHTVITTMCEAWEVRDEDIDLEACRKRDIIAGAVNESSLYRDIFRYVGYLALKLIMEAGMEVLYNRYLIIGSDRFAEVINDVLCLNGAEVDLVDPMYFDRDIIGAKRYQAIVVADYTYTEPIIANDGLITPELLIEQCPGIKVIHLAGGVDVNNLQDKGIFCYPHKHGYSRRMSLTLDYLGFSPLIELHAAGLKVGEILFREKASGASIQDIKNKLINHPLCQIIS